MTKEPAGVGGEKPLSKGGVIILSCAAGATILLFYLWAALGVVLLSILLACELVLVLAAARFGLAGPMGRMMGRHMAPLPVFFRSFWIRKGSEFRVALKPEAAPRLFSLLTRLCERAKVEPPREVMLEMTVNAWVRLKGYRRGAGKTVLGIGYDLLAGLSEPEIEAVLAHEVSHARLVQRGLNKWLRSGLNRATRLAGGLAEQVDFARKRRQSGELAQALFKPTDWLARTCARLVAACSRQDEFAADRGAAELCGSHALRSALMKLEPIGRITSRLPWRERVAQLQVGEGFSQWLVTELSTGLESQSVETKTQAFNKYGTHPSLSDRLAVLPAASAPAEVNTTPAIWLLAEPDRVAEQLMAEIQRVLAIEELKDSKALDRWSRKLGSHSHLRPVQSLGVIVGLTGLIAGVVCWLTVGTSLGLFEFMAFTIIPGALAFRLARYRDRTPLPIPDFAQLKEAFQAKTAFDEAKIKDIERELVAKILPAQNKRQKTRLQVQQLYDALRQCDYLKAHVAAKSCLQSNQKSVEAVIGLAVASAALGNAQQVTAAIQALQKRTGVTRGSAAWGTAWALFLTGNWSQAEALLRLARKDRPAEATLLAMQAICQARRGKLQSAIVSARNACTPEPRNKEYAKLVINLLLDGGFLREAQGQLERLKSDWLTDSELMFMLVRLNLMMRNTPAAEEWAERFKTTVGGARALLQLAGAYESCRHAAKASTFYTEALAVGHFPEALLGLGRLEAAKQNKEAARSHFLAVLNFQKQAAEGSCGAGPLFHAALEQLLMLHEPIPNCQAWIAGLNGNGTPAALANKSLMVYAANKADAEHSVNGLLAAMQPDQPPLIAGGIAWRQAPQEQQPFGLVRAGVQGVLS